MTFIGYIPLPNRNYINPFEKETLEKIIITGFNIYLFI